jgi:hypothetical protein
MSLKMDAGKRRRKEGAIKEKQGEQESTERELKRGIKKNDNNNRKVEGNNTTILRGF